MHRYAIYYAPPAESLIWRKGTTWLGRDPETGFDRDVPSVAGYEASELEALTRSARRYGFHATLKAPFRLASACDTKGLTDFAREFCSSRRPFPLPALMVDTLGDFIALRTASPCAELDRFAADCVTEFDRFRAPLIEDELARRGQTKLTSRQHALLQRYGYPYVLAEYRFHLTLTDTLESQHRGKLLPWLRTYFSEAVAEPVRVDALAIYAEPAPGSTFRLLRRFPFAK